MAVIFSRDWNDGLVTNQTLFGGGGQAQSVVSNRFRLASNANTFAASRLDDAPSTADFDATFNWMFRPSKAVAFTYRTTSWVNTDGTLAYIVHISGTSIDIYRGSNSTNNAWVNLKTLAVTSTANVDYLVRARAVGNYHEFWLNGIKVMDVYDSIFPNAGQFGFRIHGSVTDYCEFDNLVINDINPYASSSRTDSTGKYIKDICSATVIQVPATFTATSKDISYAHTLFTPETFNTEQGLIEIKQITPVWVNATNPIYYDATGYISGVVSIEGTPVIGAIVRLYYDPNGNFVTSTVTDNNGIFTFYNLEVGKPYYTVLSYNPGYNAYAKCKISPKKVLA